MTAVPGPSYKNRNAVIVIFHLGIRVSSMTAVHMWKNTLSGRVHLVRSRQRRQYGVGLGKGHTHKKLSGLGAGSGGGGGREREPLFTLSLVAVATGNVSIVSGLIKPCMDCR